MGGVGVGSIAWDITRVREREAWGPVPFWDKKMQGERDAEMQGW